MEKELDYLIDPLIAEALEADPEIMQQGAKLIMVEEWREIVPLLRYRADVDSMTWLKRYKERAFAKSVKYTTPLTKSDYARGRPTALFQRFIDEAYAIARESELLEKDSLQTIGVLPICTVNSLELHLAQKSASSKLIVFQLGLHECIDGLLRAVMAIEGRLPYELFNDIDFKLDGWHDDYYRAVNACMDTHDEVVSFVELLLLRTLFIGHSQGMHHLPLAASSGMMHRILLRHVELFRIGHAIAAAQGQHEFVRFPLHIGPTVAMALLPTPEGNFIADMFGGAISDAGRQHNGRKLPAEMFNYTGVAPDVCLSIFALLEDFLTALGCRPFAVEQYTPAYERRRLRRDLLTEWGDRPGIVLGQRLQFVLEALKARILPKLAEYMQRGAALSTVWQTK